MAQPKQRRSDRATCPNAVAGSSTSGPSRGPAALLGGNRQGADERGCGDRGKGFTGGRDALVPAKWRHAHGQSGPAVGSLSLLCRAGGNRALARTRLRRTCNCETASSFAIHHLARTAPECRDPRWLSGLPCLDGPMACRSACTAAETGKTRRQRPASGNTCKIASLAP